MSSCGPLKPLAICDSICHAASQSEPLGLPAKTLASPSLPKSARRMGLGGMRVAYTICVFDRGALVVNRFVWVIDL